LDVGWGWESDDADAVQLEASAQNFKNKNFPNSTHQKSAASHNSHRSLGAIIMHGLLPERRDLSIWGN
jgi:hypothetical protein